jgi:hypothetical protein
MQPTEGAANILAVRNGNATYHGADRGALGKRHHGRANKEPPVPERAHAIAAVTELEGDAAETGDSASTDALRKAGLDSMLAVPRGADQDIR